MITFDCKLPRPDFALDAKFEAKDGITALFGPSGSGKTTVIRAIAGLEPTASGKIMVGEDCLLDTDAGILRNRLDDHRERQAGQDRSGAHRTGCLHPR